MLNIEILEKDEKRMKLKLIIPKRVVISQPVYIIRTDEIVSKIDEQLKKDKTIESYEFLTDVETMKNKLSTSRTEQIVEIKLNKKKKKVQRKATISKPRAKKSKS